MYINFNKLLYNKLNINLCIALAYLLVSIIPQFGCAGYSATRHLEQQYPLPNSTSHQNLHHTLLSPSPAPFCNA